MRTEAQEQSAFFKTARLWLPEEIRGLLFASMNGAMMHGGRAGQMAKYQGMVNGVPDIQLAWPRLGYYGLFIEMKRTEEAGDSKVSEDQANMLEALNRAGYKAVVCYGCDEAMDVLRDYMLGNH